MEYITAMNNYVVVNPNGDMQGYVEIDEAVGAVDSYDLENILALCEEPRKGHMFDMWQFDDMQDSGIIYGVDNGECQIYDMDTLLEAIRESGMFQDEKDELIKELLKKDIHLNAYDKGIVGILANVDVEWT
ncbi:hypothetical protein [Clostridium cibarium]|uniref:Uncharacterized protein n=1 Tax=Clostridium cibarium TaxID=2762247 RepID=A0ABR8PY33_9CLOT|nr:hypothetical protein [Clostridium cibarium]MBD7913029.1 hypothetical protein [Clostridium cibarium]